MRLFGYPYNDLVICKDSPDYLLNYYSYLQVHGEIRTQKEREKKNTSICSLHYIHKRKTNLNLSLIH